MAKKLEALTGLPVLYDPQPVRSAEPSLRLTYLGSLENGVKSMVLQWQLSLVGAGDGPDVYLSKVLSASLRLEALYSKCRGMCYHELDVGGERIRMLFTTELNMTGSFSRNEEKIVETGQWSYLWTEPKYLAVTIPDGFWEKGD